MVSITEIMELIKTDERFTDIFQFSDDDEELFDGTLSEPETYRDQFSFVEWKYISHSPYATFIGLLKNGHVFTMDDEGTIYVLCKSFFEIPFELIDHFVRSDNIKLELHNNSENKTYLENLIFYAEWCHENNIEIGNDYLDILKREH